MLSIIISTWNSLAFLKPCLESIRNLHLDCEVIIVDSNSKDGTEQYLDNLASIQDELQLMVLYSKKRLPWSEANQTGLNMARGDWICFSNPDIVFNNSFLRLLEDCKRKNIHVAAPLLVFPDGRPQGPARTITPSMSLWIHTRLFPILSKRRRTSHVFPFDPEGGIAIPVDNPQGSLFIVDRETLDRFNGRLWHDGYLNGVSDFDAFLNLKRHGIKIWLFPQYRIVHFGSYVAKRFPKWIEKDQARGLVVYFRYWSRIQGWLSPLLYSLLFAFDGFFATGLDLLGRILKPGNPFFNPHATGWQTGQRILGLVEGWRYRIDETCEPIRSSD